MRRAVQVLGIALMAAGLLVDSSRRTRDRRTGGPAGTNHTSRLPLVLFWVGAVLLVLSAV